MNISSDRYRRILGCVLCGGTLLLHGAAQGSDANDVVVTIDRTTRAWSDLAMGAPSSEDDADHSRGTKVVFSYVPAYGKPHADAGARGLDLARLNDGKFAATGDDPANSTWFDTKGNSRVLVDLGRKMDLARINVFSWHYGALSPQRYTLWASDAESAPSPEVADLSGNWREVARVDTFPLGEGGKHGSSINPRNGSLGRYRFLLLDLPANKPEWSRSGFLSEIDVYAVGRKLEAITVIPRKAAMQTLAFGNIHRSMPLKDETEFLIASRTAELLTAKQALYRDRVLGGVRFECSDPAMNDAYVSAKANVMMSVMDLRPHYPAPFLAAGFPIYTWLFGCDSLHSTPGVAAAGFDPAARSTLECLLHYAALKKQGAHEVASNGRLLGWDHIQETPQLVVACWRHFQWTGDRAFLNAAFPVCREMLAHALATADQDHDGYLEGPGLMEQPGMGPERIDSVCQLYAAFQSLAGMASVLGEPGAEEYLRRADDLKTRFNRDWWNPKTGMWACSLRQDGTQTQDDFWAVVFPQQVGIADPDKAAIALDRIQKEWVNDEWGFIHQWKPKITGEGVGVVHNNVLARTAFSYGRPELGWRLLQLSAKAPLGERMLGAFDETLPGGGDLIQLWSFGPFLEGILEGLAGIHPQPEPHRVDLFPQLPRTLEWFKVEDCHIALHRLTLEQRRIGGRILTTITHTAGDAPLTGRFWLPAMADKDVTQNGLPVKAVLHRMQPSGTDRASLPFELPAGAQMKIEHADR